MKPHRSLATLLALMLTLLIVYASLYPFDGWRIQGIAPWTFLYAPWPRYWSRFDVVANFLGYMPLGGFLTISFLRTSLRPHPWILASTLCALFSLSLEMLQTYLPMRVPALLDWLLNSFGAMVGALTATFMMRLGWVDRWSIARRRWFVSEARAPLLLLLVWPLALLFPPAAPLALGQVRERLLGMLSQILQGTVLDALVDSTTTLLPLTRVGEVICVAAGLLIPCLLAYSITQGWRRRAIFLVAITAFSMILSSLSASISFSPEYAWSWLTTPAIAGFLIGIFLAACLLAVSRTMALILLVMALVWQLSLINLVPSTPYYAQTLQQWEQGQFIRFHGFAQWLAWIWPYAALLLTLRQLNKKLI